MSADNTDAQGRDVELTGPDPTDVGGPQLGDVPMMVFNIDIPLDPIDRPNVISTPRVTVREEGKPEVEAEALPPGWAVIGHHVLHTKNPILAGTPLDRGRSFCRLVAIGPVVPPELRVSAKFVLLPGGIPAPLEAEHPETGERSRLELVCAGCHPANGIPFAIFLPVPIR